ncbi:MAG: hypothetical protein WBD25_04980, partial [Terriglobales bacterium]
MTKSGAQQSAEEKNENQKEHNKENRKRRTPAAASHNLKRYLAPAGRSAQVESQSLRQDFHVHERLPALGSYQLGQFTNSRQSGPESNPPLIDEIGLPICSA